MFRPGTEFPKQNINFILNTGGIGDNIAALPALKFIQESYPWVTPYVYVPDYFLPLIRNMLPDIISRPFSKMKEKYNDTWAGRQTRLKGHDSLSTHLVDYNFNCLSNRQVDIKHKNYAKLDLDRINIEKFKLPTDYVVITTGFTAKIREFLPEKVNSIASYINNRNVRVVFLGSHQAATGAQNCDPIIGSFNKEINYTQGIDLINKTTLLEAGKIIANSKAIVGLDNGLMHLAGCSEVPIIGAFTSVAPHLRNPYRHNELGYKCYNVIPPETCTDRFFQSDIDFLYDVDLRFCYYGDYEMIKSLKVEDFITALEKVL